MNPDTWSTRLTALCIVLWFIMAQIDFGILPQQLVNHILFVICTIFKVIVIFGIIMFLCIALITGLVKGYWPWE